MYAPVSWSRDEGNPNNLIKDYPSVSLDIVEINPQNGQIAGRFMLGTNSYPMTGRQSGLELVVNAIWSEDRNVPHINDIGYIKNCSLEVRLTGFQTMDGVMRCQSVAPILARIALSP